MQKVIIIFSLFLVIIFNGCGNYEDSNNNYYESYIEFEVKEYLGNKYSYDYDISTYIYQIEGNEQRVIDDSYYQTLDYNTDYYDQILIKYILDDLKYISTNDIIYDYDNIIKYTWDNPYRIELNIEFWGYGGDSRIYYINLYIDGEFIDVYSAIEYNNKWYLE